MCLNVPPTARRSCVRLPSPGADGGPVRDPLRNGIIQLLLGCIACRCDATRTNKARTDSTLERDFPAAPSRRGASCRTVVCACDAARHAAVANRFYYF